jgi:DNA-binding response OmpR family regulator
MANGKKVLIIDDDQSFVWILSQSLHNDGFSILTAENGQAGLKIIEEEKPDLILLDIMMPVMDGIEMAKNLKKKSISTPVIFLTNMSDADHMSAALEIFPADYILKSDVPVNKIASQIRAKLGV